MSSTREYLDFVLDLLAEVPDLEFRKMMGEYVLYSKGKVFGGVYDDRFLLKQTAASSAGLPDAALTEPYPGGTPMLLVETEDRSLLGELVPDMLPDISPPKRRKKPASS
ncbi:TfoX/Sxy family protein [Actinomyces sp. F1_1611]